MTNKFIFAALASSLLCAGAGAQNKNVAKPVLITGLVAGSPTGNQFRMRVGNQTYRVTALAKVSLRNVRGGDRVRVWGIPTRLTLQRANVRVVQSNASDNPDDYAPAGTAGAAAPGVGTRPGVSNTAPAAGTTTTGNRTMSNGTMSNGTMGATGRTTMGNGTTTKLGTTETGRMTNGTTGTKTR